MRSDSFGRMSFCALMNAVLVILLVVTASPLLAEAGASVEKAVAINPVNTLLVTLQPGIDAWHTPEGGGTFAGFATDPIPADFFCTGSPAFTGNIPLRGARLLTSPPGALGGNDTVIERTSAAGIPKNGCGSVPITIRAMALEDIVPLVVSCDSGSTSWDVKVTLAPFQQTSSITVCRSSGCGGTFTGNLSVTAWTYFTERNSGVVVGPLQRTVNLNIRPVPWAHKNFPGGHTVSGPFTVDSDCDGILDLSLPGNSNFFPGVECVDDPIFGGKKEQKKQQVCCHNGGNQPYDHCIIPWCPEDPPIEDEFDGH